MIPNDYGVEAIGIPLNFNLLPQYLKPYGFKSHVVGKYSNKKHVIGIIKAVDTVLFIL